METKLTLKLNKDIIDRVKIFAEKRNISLSKMVEKYFKSLVDKNKAGAITPVVKELSGIIDLNEKNGYVDYLINKYK